MNIGILQTAYKKSNDYGAFYNVQELGLARALATKGHNVTLYKAVDGDAKEYSECDDRLCVRLVSVRYIGINGLFNTSNLDNSLEVLIYFCDTQLKVHNVYKWCQANDVIFIPYIGVIESHSENIIKRFIMNYLAKRNIRIFRKCLCFAKTPVIADKLQNVGCNKVELFPVGLDETVMHNKVDDHRKNDNIRLLFIGRMEEEKQPFEMIRMFEKIIKIDSSVQMTMIGDGYMYEESVNRLNDIIRNYRLSEGQAQIIRKVPYSEMHSYYENADLYINLNEVEILGMSILEAMYYNCPVLAVVAPGPEFILRTNIGSENSNEYSDEYCGMLAPDMDSLFEVLKLVVNREISNEELKRIASLANMRVKSNFVWDTLADRLIEMVDMVKVSKC